MKTFTEFLAEKGIVLDGTMPSATPAANAPDPRQVADALGRMQINPLKIKQLQGLGKRGEAELTNLAQKGMMQGIKPDIVYAAFGVNPNDQMQK